MEKQLRDYFDKRTQQYLCIAFEQNGPKVVGGYSASACQQCPGFQNLASKRIWAAYLEECYIDESKTTSKLPSQE